MTNSSTEIHIGRFIVAPGIEPGGYSCEGVEVIRKPGETVEALHKRCLDSVPWPGGTSRHIFDLLVVSTCH